MIINDRWQDSCKLEEHFVQFFAQQKMFFASCLVLYNEVGNKRFTPCAQGKSFPMYCSYTYYKIGILFLIQTNILDLACSNQENFALAAHFALAKIHKKQICTNALGVSQVYSTLIVSYKKDTYLRGSQSFFQTMHENIRAATRMARMFIYHCVCSNKIVK